MATSSTVQVDSAAGSVDKPQTKRSNGDLPPQPEHDFDVHPTELKHVPAGTVDTPDSQTLRGIQDLKNAIPAHCFQPSLLKSFWYLSRDIFFSSVLTWAAVRGIPLIPTLLGRSAAWAAYGFVQGLLWTGIWVIGHECGHSAFSTSHAINNIVGFVLHSFLLTPYFAWRSTHRRHHIYANNMMLDHNYVPPRREEYERSFAKQRDEAGEDAPLYVLFRILVQQLFGFPMYLLTNITASPKSLHRVPSRNWLGNSHLVPFGPLFRPDEALQMVLSDIGVTGMGLYLWKAGQTWGSAQVMLLYLQPYLWVNHWIVMITYLHHTHPDVPKFEPEAWTFIKGATATIDREFGLIGKHFFHNIIEFHVIHHLFSRIPQYHAEEATLAIKPLLGAQYHQDKQRSYLGGLWESFTQCQWVSPDESENAKDRRLWYKGGRIPPPEYAMAQNKWSSWIPWLM